MYQLLFRSRWFALAWGLMTAVSAVLFTTTGAGAVLTGTASKPSASEGAASKQNTPKAWARDEQAGEEAHEATGPDRGPDGVSGDSEGDTRYRTVPFADADSDTVDVSIDE